MAPCCSVVKELLNVAVRLTTSQNHFSKDQNSSVWTSNRPVNDCSSAFRRTASWILFTWASHVLWTNIAGRKKLFTSLTDLKNDTEILFMNEQQHIWRFCMDLSPVELPEHCNHLVYCYNQSNLSLTVNITDIKSFLWDSTVHCRDYKQSWATIRTAVIIQNQQ